MAKLPIVTCECCGLIERVSPIEKGGIKTLSIMISGFGEEGVKKLNLCRACLVTVLQMINQGLKAIKREISQTHLAAAGEEGESCKE